MDSDQEIQKSNKEKNQDLHEKISERDLSRRNFLRQMVIGTFGIAGTLTGLGKIASAAEKTLNGYYNGFNKYLKNDDVNYTSYSYSSFYSSSRYYCYSSYSYYSYASYKYNSQYFSSYYSYMSYYNSSGYNSGYNSYKSSGNYKSYGSYKSYLSTVNKSYYSLGYKSYSSYSSGNSKYTSCRDESYYWGANRKYNSCNYYSYTSFFYNSEVLKK